jgi:hypothetical protein
MSQSVAESLTNRNVVASLQPGPKGTVRIAYDHPRFEMPREWSRQLEATRQFAVPYAPPVIEIDRKKLRKLQFSEAELAEIGFSLVLRLWALNQRVGPHDA